MPNLSSSQFPGLSGPSDAELAGIESGAPEAESYGSFTADQVEGLRRMNERVDPAYARTRAARRGGAGLSTSVNLGGSINKIDAARVSEEAAATSGDYVKNPSLEEGSSGDDPANLRPSMAGSGAGAFGGAPSRYWETHKQNAGYQTGVFMLRTAGRCEHPRCKAIRAKGMELMGAENRFQTGGGDYWETSQPPIPSVPVDTRTYPVRGGKEDRSNAQTVREYKVADKNHPEWKALVAQDKLGGESIFQPQDLLEHHHPAGDMDFEKYPLPWDQ